MASPILNQIGTVFIPVSSIEKARDWYRDILGIPADGEILFGVSLYGTKEREPRNRNRAWAMV